MFQRLKNFNLDSLLDTKIAEEQARQNGQKQGTDNAARRASTTGAVQRRGQATAGKRTQSPANRPSGSRTRAASTLGVQLGKGPDPDDFVIGDDGSDISRAATPRPKELDDVPSSDVSAEKAKDAPAAVESGSEKEKEKDAGDGLSEDIRKKLTKLDNLTSRYQDLLKNYRQAHARVAQIEPFESTLRLHTPLTNINDPTALVEFLDQRSKQGDMVMAELKRISGEHKHILDERNQLKTKLDEAERNAKEAYDEAAGLRIRAANSENADKDQDGDTFFSQDDEIEAERKKRKNEDEKQVEYIHELETENAQFRQDIAQYQHDLDMKKLDVDAIGKKLEVKEQINAELTQDLSTAKAKLSEAQRAQPEPEKDASAQKRDEQRLKTYEEVVNKLRSQVKDAEDTRKLALSKVNDLNFEIKKLEAEVSSSEGIISRLRPLEQRSQTLTKQLAEAERTRDEAQRVAESKKGHEAAVASLRSQLKRAVEDRDAAYQMVLDCGKCKAAEEDENESTATRSQSTSEPADKDADDTVDPPEASESGDVPVVSSANPAEAKKKKRKKPKNKKNAQTESTSAEPSVADLVADSQQASKTVSRESATNQAKMQAAFLAMVKKHRDARDTDVDDVRTHFETMIEERDQKLKDQVLLIRDREDEITQLKSQITEKEKIIERIEKELKDQESLQEEVETLRESLTDLGGEVTDAKRNAADAKIVNEKLQDQLHAAELDASSATKDLIQQKSQLEMALQKSAQLEQRLSDTHSSAESVAGEELSKAKAELQDMHQKQQSLQDSKIALEKQVEDLRSEQNSRVASDDDKDRTMTAELNRLQARSTTLETDLAAANLLAQNRYKELTETKDRFSKVQPEVKRLREESAQLKSVKADFEKSSSTIKQLEAKQRDLNAEIAEHKTQVHKRDNDIKDLKDKVKKARERNSALEDTYERSRKDIEEHQRVRDEAVDARDKLQQQMEKVQQDRRSLKSQVDGLERQVKSLTEECRSVREELQTKSAKHASAQTHMTSMQDQSNEMAVQMREAQQRCNSLEEELADSQRLLSERSREAETMRRLLSDVESRAETRVKEMRERLDLATEERDRAEDESASLGRKRAREVEDYKNRLRDLERDMTRAHDAKVDAERKEADIRSRQQDIEHRLTLAQTEVTDVRQVVSQLREALDQSEQDAKGLEKQKIELRRNLEEREVRLEKLQKSSKAMAEELRVLQTRDKRQESIQSSRSSMDSNMRVISPGPKPAGTGHGISSANTKAEGSIDYVYLKNILLQFLEQKEKKTQMQLVPVLGMLLHFDKTEEAKWMSVVSAK